MTKSEKVIQGDFEQISEILRGIKPRLSEPYTSQNVWSECKCLQVNRYVCTAAHKELTQE